MGWLAYNHDEGHCPDPGAEAHAEPAKPEDEFDDHPTLEHGESSVLPGHDDGDDGNARAIAPSASSDATNAKPKSVRILSRAFRACDEPTEPRVNGDEMLLELLRRAS